MGNVVSGFLTSHTGGFIQSIEPLDYLDYLDEKEKLIINGFIPYDTAPNASLLEIKIDVFQKNTHPLNLYGDIFTLFNPADKEFELFVASKRLEEIVDIEKRLSDKLLANIVKKKGKEVEVLLEMS